MNLRRFMLALAALLACGASLGQTATQGERPIRPESASNAAIGGWCDALTGTKKEECLRDERRRQEEKAKEGRSTGGSCDGLIGPERERCLRQGGSIEVGTGSHGADAGATRRDH
jgi:hypothetical protein